MATLPSVCQLFEDRLGVKLKSEWYQAAFEALRSNHSFSSSAPEQQMQMLFALFLESDLTTAGSGGLPANLKEWHKKQLEGRFVVQVNEMVNIAAPIKERYKPAGNGRCLKLHMTDGVQELHAMEFCHIPALQVLAPAGFKVTITDAEVKRGVLLLRPENLLVLGGKVDRLEEARQKMLERWAEPPGRQERGALPPGLMRDMAEAAWRQPGAANAQPRGMGPLPSRHPAGVAPTARQPQPPAQGHPSTSQPAQQPSSSSAGASASAGPSTSSVPRTAAAHASFRAQPPPRGNPQPPMTSVVGGRTDHAPHPSASQVPAAGGPGIPVQGLGSQPAAVPPFQNGQRPSTSGWRAPQPPAGSTSQQLGRAGSSVQQAAFGQAGRLQQQSGCSWHTTSGGQNQTSQPALTQASGGYGRFGVVDRQGSGQHNSQMMQTNPPQQRQPVQPSVPPPSSANQQIQAQHRTEPPTPAVATADAACRGSWPDMDKGGQPMDDDFVYNEWADEDLMPDEPLHEGMYEEPMEVAGLGPEAPSADRDTRCNTEARRSPAAVNADVRHSGGAAVAAVPRRQHSVAAAGGNDARHVRDALEQSSDPHSQPQTAGNPRKRRERSSGGGHHGAADGSISMSAMESPLLEGLDELGRLDDDVLLLARRRSRFWPASDASARKDGREEAASRTPATAVAVRAALEQPSAGPIIISDSESEEAQGQRKGRGGGHRGDQVATAAVRTLRMDSSPEEHPTSSAAGEDADEGMAWHPEIPHQRQEQQQRHCNLEMTPSQRWPPSAAVEADPTSGQGSACRPRQQKPPEQEGQATAASNPQGTPQNGHLESEDTQRTEGMLPSASSKTPAAETPMRPREPLMSRISDFLAQASAATPSDYPVSACVALAVRRAASKLTMAGGCYSLLLEVEDESMVCMVAVDHDIIQSQLGASPEQLRREVTAGNAERHNRLKTFLAGFEGVAHLSVHDAAERHPTVLNMRRNN